MKRSTSTKEFVLLHSIPPTGNVPLKGFRVQLFHGDSTVPTGTAITNKDGKFCIPLSAEGMPQLLVMRVSEAQPVKMAYGEIKYTTLEPEIQGGMELSSCPSTPTIHSFETCFPIRFHHRFVLSLTMISTPYSCKVSAKVQGSDVF